MYIVAKIIPILNEVMHKADIKKNARCIVNK